jgi:hypothetical protein
MPSLRRVKGHHVAEHHRHGAALALPLGYGGPIDDAFDHPRVDIFAEGLADALLEPQLLGHAVEGDGQVADLVGRTDLDHHI